MTPRRTAALALAVLTLALGACAPVAQLIADGIDNSDGATLAYVLTDMPGGPGLTFKPGPAPARGVIVRIEGDTLAILSVPPGATCTLEAARADCRLGNVTDPVFIGATGQNVAANATWRRVGAKVYITFARLETP